MGVLVDRAGDVGSAPCEAAGLVAVAFFFFYRLTPVNCIPVLPRVKPLYCRVTPSRHIYPFSRPFPFWRVYRWAKDKSASATETMDTLGRVVTYTW